MIGETAAAVLERATATDHAMRGAPRAYTPLIIDETPDTMTNTEKPYLTLQDVADRLKLKLRTVREHETRGILPASRLGRRVRVSEDQYREYVRRLEALGTGGEIEDVQAPAVPVIQEMITRAVLDYLDSPIGRARFAEMIREELARQGGA
jgi:excisionase family DNA binding protein